MMVEENILPTVRNGYGLRKDEEESFCYPVPEEGIAPKSNNKIGKAKTLYPQRETAGTTVC